MVHVCLVAKSSALCSGIVYRHWLEGIRSLYKGLGGSRLSLGVHLCVSSAMYDELSETLPELDYESNLDKQPALT